MANKANAPNWKKIKTDYLAGKPIKDIAQKYGVSVSAINSRRTREGWASDKADVASKARQKCIEKIADEQASIMAQMAVLHDRAGLVAFKKLMKQFEDFPDSGATTKIIRQSVKVQEIDMGDGKDPIKMPLRTMLASDLSETVKNFTAMSKVFGFDAASKLAAQKIRLENGFDQPDSDGGFIEALDDVRPDAWDIEDIPLNITDTEDAGSEGAE